MKGNQLRTRRSADEWRVLVEKQRESGDPVERFCASHKLYVSSFYHWRGKLARVENKFITVQHPLNRAAIVVEHDGMRIHVHDRAILDEVLEALRRSRCS